MSDRTAPKCQLRLEWVYGYRGHQVRTNLFYDFDHQIIYFVAGVAIVYNPVEQKQRFFLGHDDDIISLTMHPSKVLVATGQVGKTPQILIWNTRELETVSILKGGLTDGVGILAFDQTGERLVSCSIDQDSTIIVWDWRKAKIIAKTNIHQEKVFDVQFNPYKENCLVSCGLKHINFWKLIGNTLQKKKGIFGQIKDMQTIFCLAFSKEDEVYYSGTINGDIYIWRGTNLGEMISGAHDGTVYSITSCSDGYVTAGKDGKIRFWDPKFNAISIYNLKETVGCDEMVIRSISWNDDRLLVGTQSSEIYEILINDQDHPKLICQGHAEGELWALSVSPINPNKFATASDDKTIRIWDMKTKSVEKTKKLDKKIRSCSFSADEKQLACGLSDGTLVVLDLANNMNEIFRSKIRSEVLHEMKYSPCGNFLAVGSNDNYVDIVDTNNFEKLGTCKGNSSFITHLDWAIDSQYIRTNSGAGENLVFKVPSAKQVTNSEELKKIHWATFTGVLGAEVDGIWEKYTNKTDVNATDTYFDEQCMVTGDDFGLVKLFRFPSLKKGAKFKKYVGHSSHVTNVRFNADKTRVITIGGADHAVFQWRFLSEDQALSVNANQTAQQIQTRSLYSIPQPGAKEIEVEEFPEAYDAYMDSDSEDSDSELSNREIDSDVEKEKEVSYDRPVYKEDLQVLKPKMKEEVKNAETILGEKRQKRPDVSLSLKYVFGYRGYDCRDNLFCLQPNGLIIYHVAALGIVYNRETNKQTFYDYHTDDILCLCVHPLKNYIATGQIGRDPPIHVWEAETLKTISILKGEHYRGICSLSFSSDGKKLASVGLDDYHTICVWDWRKGERLATARGHKDKIFCVKWNPHDPDKLVSVGVKHIKFWNQVGGGFTSHRGIFGTLSKVENIMCVTYGKTSEVCYTGVGNGCIYHWQNQKLINIVKAHTGPVFAIYALDRWEGYVTGGKDGCVILWNEDFSNPLKKYTCDKKSISKTSKGVLFEDNPSIRSICLAYTFKKVLVGTKNGEIIEIDRDGTMNILCQGHAEGELWGLACHPKKSECCTASDDKTMRIWDLDNKVTTKVKVFDKAARSCEYSPDGSILAIGMKDGSVVVANANTLEDLKVINNRNQEISDVRFSPVYGKYLAVASHDNLVDIYHVENKKRIGICKGSSSYISHIDWDKEGRLLMVNSGARELLFYEAPRGNRININANEVFNVNWDTVSGVLGPNLEGIWPPCTDVTDVNSTCLSKVDNVIATGDDFGFVKLFEYPCKGKFSKFKRYVGHSAHVTRVRWTHNGCQLISIGGRDTAILVWDYISSNTATPARSIQAKTNESKLDVALQNTRKGESEDSATDSEDEGYDSDVKREKSINYFQSMFINTIKRPTADAVKTMHNDAKILDRSEINKPSRMTSNRLKRTRVKKMIGKKGEEVDPWILLRFITNFGEQVESGTIKNKMRSEGLEVQLRAKTEIKELKLSHIHGYRGIDCRDNLFYLDDDTKIVYCAAGAGIVLDLNTGVQSFYLEHTDDIISLALNRNPKFKNIIATGQIGVTPVIHIWDATTLETISILSGLHKNGICSLDFSSSGRYLVSVGLDNNYTIGVWRWKDGSLAASHAGDLHEHRIFRTAFRPDSDTVFVSVGFKHVQFWTVCGSQLMVKKAVLTDWSSTGQRLHKMPTMLSLAFGQDEITYTGSINGDIYVWKENVLTNVILGAHKGPIFTMYTCLFDGCIITGAKEKITKDSGPIKLWSKQMKKSKPFNLDNLDISVVKSVCRIKNKIIFGTKSNEVYEINEKTSNVTRLISGHSDSAIWGLAVHPTKDIFITASYDGYLKLWSVSKKSLVSYHKIKRPIRCVDFDKDGIFIAVGLVDGEIIIIKCNDDYSRFEICDSNRQRAACITDIKFSPNNQGLAVGSQDSSVDFFEFNSSSGKIVRIGYCIQVPGSVLQMDWSNDSTHIRLGTGSYQNVIYKVPNGDQLKDKDLQDNIVWDEWTSIFGEEVVGIWPSDAKQDFVNCAHLATHASVLATGDDNGAVKLFPFPCMEKDPELQQSYYGHSSNIANIKFICDNTYLISTGGEDYCIFVWQCN